MAEVVRGGLQAIPKGQYEGAMALGLGYWQMMQKIILPQALKIVIPGIVNTFIGLFKDTTLVSIIGLLDFLGMINLSHSDSNWATPVQAITSYIFCAFVFFVFCYAMARYSNYMERQARYRTPLMSQRFRCNLQKRFEQIRNSTCKKTGVYTQMAKAAAKRQARKRQRENKAPAKVAKPASPDDLKRISGVGPKLEGVLNELGIYRLSQIAKWTKARGRTGSMTI